MAAQKQANFEERKNSASIEENHNSSKRVPSANAKTKKIKDNIDKLLDEIDEILEENAEEFIANYKQRGGE